MTAVDLHPQKLWATTLFARMWRLFPQHSEALVNLMYELRDNQEQSIASGVATISKASYGIYEGDFDLFKINHPDLNMLKQFIVESIQQTVSVINGSEVPPNDIDVHIDDAWFHITNDGGFHDSHVHGGCSWCGIFYLQCGETGKKEGVGAPNGANCFYSPHSLGGHFSDYGNKYLTDLSMVAPPVKDGMLLLFPSFLLHSALPYRGQKDRIVIAFNSRSYAKDYKTTPR